MARVLLIMPELPQPMGLPYIGQQYIAASLLAEGHQVRVLDRSARLYQGDDADIDLFIERWDPDLIGMTLFTCNALAGYRLADRLRKYSRLLVAGGPHPTATGDEALNNGFDVVVEGEGDLAIRQLATHLDEGWGLETIAGVRFHGGRGPAPVPIDDLDGLPFPHESYSSFEGDAYSKDGSFVAGGLSTSRGCPARCTFCANYVTGREYRWRSPQDVIDEMTALRELYGQTHFPLWDDAFTARRSRLRALCDAILTEPRLGGVTWTCSTPGNMVDSEDLRRMRAAGCLGINFGVESGDPGILRNIQKGVHPEQVKAAVLAAKREGMLITVNVMFGFPGEGIVELNRTLKLMEELAPNVDYFNNRGVLVPFPGTAIYERWHQEFDFTEWWLDPEQVTKEPSMFEMTADVSQEYLEDDPSLELNFFDYSHEIRDKIAECVRYKGKHNQATICRLSGVAR